MTNSLDAAYEISQARLVIDRSALFFTWLFTGLLFFSDLAAGGGQVFQFVDFLAIFVSRVVLRRRQVVGVRHRFLPVDF